MEITTRNELRDVDKTACGAWVYHASSNDMQTSGYEEFVALEVGTVQFSIKRTTKSVSSTSKCRTLQHRVSCFEHYKELSSQMLNAIPVNI